MSNNLNETKQLNKESRENAISFGNLSSVSGDITSEELNKYTNIAMSQINDDDMGTSSHLGKIQEVNEKSSENKEIYTGIH